MISKKKKTSKPHSCSTKISSNLFQFTEPFLKFYTNQFYIIYINYLYNDANLKPRMKIEQKISANLMFRPIVVETQL